MKNYINIFFIKKIFNKFKKIIFIYKKNKLNYLNNSFIQINNIPLSEKEKESYRILNEVWGDDEDQVYTKHTYYCLTKKHINK